MRQILYGQQWIHPETPAEIQDIFRRLGRREFIKKGTEIRHGVDGDVTFLLSGLGLYKFWDWKGNPHVFALILPNRTMGEIDGFCKNVANVCAYIAEDSEALVLPYSVWHREITKNTELCETAARNLVQKQESHIEALLSCFTMEVDERLKSLFHAITTSYYQPSLTDWNELPVRLNTVLLSNIISASRTSVSLTLTRWEEEGKIQKQDRTHNLLIHGRLYKELYDWWEG